MGRRLGAPEPQLAGGRLAELLLVRPAPDTPAEGHPAQIRTADGGMRRERRGGGAECKAVEPRRKGFSSVAARARLCKLAHDKCYTLGARQPCIRCYTEGAGQGLDPGRALTAPSS